MAKLLGALNEHVSRMARRASKPQMAHLKRNSATHRRDIAALKRALATMARRLGALESAPRSAAAVPAAAPGEMQRFSPAGLKTHRSKLDLSAKDYAALIGVTALSVYNWEARKSRPRQAQLARIAAVRKLGKREATKLLEKKR